MSKRLFATAAVVVILGAVVCVPAARRLRAASPQTGGTDPAFEVASVKINKSADGRAAMFIQPGGRLVATNLPLRFLIRNAYQLQDFQLVGGPDWITSERFDIEAKAAGEVPPTPPGGPPGPLQLMLQRLLIDRFKLVAHKETRELPIYALVLARKDGRLGSQLRPSTVDCQALPAAARGRGGPPPAPPPPSERMTCGIRNFLGQMSGGGMPLAQLANVLSIGVQRIVVDRTGLAGNFDFDLTWTPDQLPQGPRPPDAPPIPPIDPNGPSIFTAVQEQLGLKLDSEKGQVDVLVIESVERPTED